MSKAGVALGAGTLAMMLVGAALAQTVAEPNPGRAQGAERFHGASAMRDGAHSRMGYRMGGGGRQFAPTMLLRAADADQDGAATRQEIDALQDEDFAWRDRNGDGVLDAADRGPIAQRLTALRADQPRDPWSPSRRGADGDARLTRADTAARTDALFERLDADGDGRITAEEARTGRRGPGGGDGRL